ncbi:MAG: AMP-binding protein, partial [bacterium]|nr:AMP-binding protein [bacterium]
SFSLPIGFSRGIHESPLQRTVHLTYRQLDREANRIALYLQNKRSIKPGNRVGVLMDRSLNLLPAILGILKAGAVYLPLVPDLPEERIKFMINDAVINILFSEKKHLRILNRLQWECDSLHTYFCMDSYDIHTEEESEKNQLMDIELWNNVGETATDEITGGGWISSYTGQPFTKKEMDEYGDNVLKKLEPLLHKKMRVLEIGCASGITMFRIAPEVGEYYGIDLSKVIIERNKKRVHQENLQNIKLFCLAAHEIHQIETQHSGRFDLIIINSVIQCFPGHNYLRNIIRKAATLLGEEGTIFVGDVMDQQLKKSLEKELTEFKYRHRDKGYTTKTDLSAELFVHKGFWKNLQRELQEIKTVTLSPKLYTVENELTKFRYDVLITPDKNVRSKKEFELPAQAGEKSDVLQTPEDALPFKYQEDLRALPGEKIEHKHNTSRIPGLSLNVESTAPAYIIYTSGTSGRPKGAIIRHSSLVNFVYGMYRRFDNNFSIDDNCLSLTTPSFDVSVAEIFIPLSFGSTLFLMPEEKIFDVNRLSRILVDMGITFAYIPPSLLKTVFERLSALTGGELNKLLVGVEPIPDNVLEDFQGLAPSMKIVNAYGPTEATICATAGVYHAHESTGQMVPIGGPLDNSRVYILGKDHHIKPVGVPGELCIAGDSLALGYLNKPELTSEKFVNYKEIAHSSK